MYKDNSVQRWLILSHCFNMDGRAASITITDKLPFLEQAGIEPIILSGISGSRDKHYRHYQFLPWGPAGWRFDIRHVIAMRIGRGVLYKVLVGLLGLVLAPLILIEKGLLGWSNQWSWAFPATLRSLWLIKKFKPTVLYTTGGAYSAHLAGYWIKRITGIKWIVEVHDPMVKPGMQPVTREEKMMAYIEGRICAQADLAWWFTDGALAGAKSRHPELESRGAVILPGVGKPTVTAQYQHGEKFIISHFGSLSDTRSMQPFVQALKILFDESPELRDKIQVHVYGGSIDSAGRAAIALNKLENVFVQHGRLEYSVETGLSGREQVLQKMHQADCLLLIHGTIPDCREYIPSKLYEYLWTGRPVLALTYQNPQLDDLVNRYSGYLAPCDQNVEIARTLKAAYSDWQNDRLKSHNLPGVSVKQAVDSILHHITQTGQAGRHE